MSTRLYTVLAVILAVSSVVATQLWNDPGRGAVLLVAMAIMLLCREVSRNSE